MLGPRNQTSPTSWPPHGTRVSAFTMSTSVVLGLPQPTTVLVSLSSACASTTRPAASSLERTVRYLGPRPGGVMVAMRVASASPYAGESAAPENPQLANAAANASSVCA